MYSIMLYMKTRVTFRVAPELATQLRELPNQTAFVESALRSALGLTCPVCEGTGSLSVAELLVSNFRRCRLPPLDRASAIELKRLVRVARSVAATRLDVFGDTQKGGFGFVLKRGSEVVLAGTLPGPAGTEGAN